VGIQDKQPTIHKMASKSGMFLNEDERKRLIQALEASGDLPRSTSSGDFPVVGDDTGCLICGRDDDHSSLMLCEGCNDEYHTYCLDPPLPAVPHDDWYCGRLKQSVPLCVYCVAQYSVFF